MTETIVNIDVVVTTSDTHFVIAVVSGWPRKAVALVPKDARELNALLSVWLEHHGDD